MFKVPYGVLFSKVQMVGSLVVGLAFGFFTMILWYITQPVVFRVINTSIEFAAEKGGNNTYAMTGLAILKQIGYWWGPLLVIAVLILWMVVAAQARDWRGVEEGV